MSMGQGFNIDSRSVLIDKLGEDSKSFRRSCLNFKNTKGIKAIYEMGKLRAELLDFAKDPSIAQNQLGDAKPRPPKTENLTTDEINSEMQDYYDLLRQWNMAQAALRMQVPVADLFAIEQYMEPLEDALNATPAVKGKRFHAFTKQVEEEQQGFLNFGKRQQR